MEAFRRTADGYSSRLTPDERGALSRLVTDVLTLIDTEPRPAAETRDLLAFLDDGPVRVPTDPAVARLLPDASRDDPELAAEFRRLTQADLRATKCAGLELLAQALCFGDQVSVGDADAPRMAAALTDVRLVLAERLELRSDADAETLHRDLERAGRRLRHRRDQRVALGEVYEALSWWQESLVVAMTARLPDGPGRAPAVG